MICWSLLWIETFPPLIQKNIQVLHWFSTLVLWCSCCCNRMTISKLFNTWLVHYHPLVVTSTFFFLFAIEFCMLRIMNRNSGKYAVELFIKFVLPGVIHFTLYLVDWPSTLGWNFWLMHLIRQSMLEYGIFREFLILVSF